MPKASTPPSLEISQHYHSKSGDVDLISSDNVRFKVHSYRLKSASHIFRKRIGSARRSPSTPFELRLEDPSHNAAVVKTFLDILHTKPIPSDVARYLKHLANVLPFLLHHECHSTLFVFSMILRDLTASDNVDVFKIFSLGALANDPATCARAIAAQSHCTWSYSDESEDEKGATNRTEGNAVLKPPTVYQRALGAYPMEVTARNWESFAALPPRYAHALLRAESAAGSIDDDTNWLYLSRDFEWLMDTIDDSDHDDLEPDSGSSRSGSLDASEEQDGSGDDSVNKGGPGDTEEHARYSSSDADTHLISSDNVLFKVHSQLLANASSVFRSMYTVGALPSTERPAEVRLSDDHLEIADILESFLDILYGKHVSYASYEAVSKLKDLIPFVDKYNCEAVKQTICLILRSYLGEEVSPGEIFLAGALADDPVTCRKAIAACGTWKISWPRGAEKDWSRTYRLNDDRGLESYLYGASVLDLSAMSFEDYAEMPPKFTHLLLRASRATISLDPGKADWDAVAKEFDRLVKTL